MIYLIIKHQDGSVSTIECQNWRELSFNIDEAMSIFQVERMYVTLNKQAFHDKIGELLE